MKLFGSIEMSAEDAAEHAQTLKEVAQADAARAERDAPFWAWVTRGCKGDDPYLQEESDDGE